MHEMGIAMQIIDTAKGYLPKNLAHKKIEKIHLDIGKLAGIVHDSLTFCFEIASQGTPLEGARLVINDIAVTFKCNQCHSIYSDDTSTYACIFCKSTAVDMITGSELTIKSLEIED